MSVSYNKLWKLIIDRKMIKAAGIAPKVSLQPSKWYCHLFAQEYTIGRYEKDENGDSICIAEEL